MNYGTAFIWIHFKVSHKSAIRNTNLWFHNAFILGVKSTYNHICNQCIHVIPERHSTIYLCC
jgi:hypothetical protein